MHAAQHGSANQSNFGIALGLLRTQSRIAQRQVGGHAKQARRAIQASNALIPEPSLCLEAVQFPRQDAFSQQLAFPESICAAIERMFKFASACAERRNYANTRDHHAPAHDPPPS